MSSLSSDICDAIPLTAAEKVRKEQLEAIVARGLAQFLEVGNALAELRNARLYRTSHATFEQYVRDRFCLARSSVDQLIRSASTANSLIESGCVLPTNVTEAAIRPISSLPGYELKSACWQLVQSVSPARTPTQPLVSKVARLIRNLVEGDDQAALRRSAYRSGQPRSSEPLERETPFVRPILRLSSWTGFSAEMIVSHLGPATNAAGVYSACGILASRCREVQERLLVRSPELIHVEHHRK